MDPLRSKLFSKFIMRPPVCWASIDADLEYDILLALGLSGCEELLLRGLVATGCMVGLRVAGDLGSCPVSAAVESGYALVRRRIPAGVGLLALGIGVVGDCRGPIQ